jgi:hypothetical protein
MTGSIKHLALPVALALTLPAWAQQPSRASGDLEPLDSDQLDAARVPLTSDPEPSDDEAGGREWLEEQRRRMLEQQEYRSGREPPRSGEGASSGQLAPFQKNFRDALIEQLRTTSEGVR